MEIRRYQPDDAAGLLGVFNSSMRRVVAREYTAEQIARWAPDAVDAAAWAARLAQSQPFVAVVDGRLAGFAELEPDGHLDRFYCHADFQRRGIGTALLAAVEHEAAHLGLTRLYAESSTTAIEFFRARGFEVTAERENVICNAPAKQYLIAKPLHFSRSA